MDIRFDDDVIKKAVLKSKTNDVFTRGLNLINMLKITMDLPAAVAVTKNFDKLTPKETSDFLEVFVPFVERCKEIDAKYGFSKEENDGD